MFGELFDIIKHLITLERKLASIGEVERLVVGAFSEVSAATHTLIVHLEANCDLKR